MLAPQMAIIPFKFYHTGRGCPNQPPRLYTLRMNVFPCASAIARGSSRDGFDQIGRLESGQELQDICLARRVRDIETAGDRPAKLADRSRLLQRLPYACSYLVEAEIEG